MRIAWTGHRPDVFLDPVAARARLDALAHEIATQGAEVFLVGGQRGVDTWAAQAAMREAIPFQVILPLTVSEFTGDWLEADRGALMAVLERAAGVEIAGSYAQRNRALATSAELLIAVWTGTAGGGTAETIVFARDAGTPIREIVLPPALGASCALGHGV